MTASDNHVIKDAQSMHKLYATLVTSKNKKDEKFSKP
jgi:hypothetical protein